MKLAKIICIEGPDQMGKQTQANLLFDSFKNTAQREIPFKDYFTYSIIYFMLENKLAKRYPNLFQFIQFCNKFLFQFMHLFPMMLMYDFIILDRWSASSIVYGSATGVNFRFNQFLQKFLITPDLTLVLSGKQYKRPYEKNDSYESDKILQENVKKGYDDFVKNNKETCVIINNVGDIFDVHHRILAEVLRLQTLKTK